MKVLFTILYFLCFFAGLRWLVNELPLPLSATMGALTLFALFVLLALSIGLAEFTVGKIREYYRKH